MPELLPFCKIKLQYLSEMASDPELGDQAFRIISYLALIHADHETGEARPTFETIAKATGRDPKSVKRALQKAEAAGYLEIERGTISGTRRAIDPPKRLWNARQSAGTSRTKLSPFPAPKGDKTVQQGGQICPAKGDRNVPRT